MKFDSKLGVVTIVFAIFILIYVIADRNNKYDLRPEPLLIEFVRVESFKSSGTNTGSRFGAAHVEQSKKEGSLTGWIWPRRGFLRVYSSGLTVNQILVRRLGIFRPDVESAKDGNSDYRFSGIDFDFEVTQYGLIECVVWTDGTTEDLVWVKSTSKCNQ